MATEKAAQMPRHDGAHAPHGALAKFLSDPAKVGFAALLLLSVALLESWLLWNKLRDRVRTEVIAAVPSPAPAPATAPLASSAPAAAPPPATVPTPAPVADKPAAPTKSTPPQAPREPAASTATQAAPPTKAPPAASKPAKEEARPDIRKPPATAAEPKRAPRKPEPMPPAKAVESPAPQPVQPAPSPATVPAPRPVPPPPSSGQALEPVSRAPLQFPIAAVRQGISTGRVKARATIDAGGNVIAVEIVNAYPQRLFDRAVTESVSLWKFPPGADRRSYEVDVEFNR